MYIPLKRGYGISISLTLLLFFQFSLISCVSQRKVLDSWLGSTKQSLILAWGPPARTTSDGGSGEVLIYSSNVYDAYNRIAYYKYTMFYIYSGGTIYHWLTRADRIPPQELNVNLYLR